MENVILKPNTPHVVAEDFENEIIIVNLYNGNYYSLRGSAALIWKLLVQEPSYNALISHSARAYGINEQDVADAIASYVEQLLADRMITSEPMNGHGEKALTIPETTGVFEAPHLESYSDMQDLLLLDPIHDVDEEKGWPERKD